MQHATGTVGFQQQFPHPPGPAFRGPGLTEQGLGQDGDPQAGVVVIDHPLPFQSLAGPWVRHRPEHLSVIGGLVVARVGHVAQSWRRSLPPREDFRDQGRQFVGHRLLPQFRWLGQVDRSEAFSLPVVDGHRGGGCDLERIARLHPQRDAVAANAQHRPLVSFPVKGLLQPRQHLFRLERPTERLHGVGQACRHLPEFFRAPDDSVLTAEAVREPRPAWPRLQPGNARRPMPTPDWPRRPTPTVVPREKVSVRLRPAASRDTRTARG